jgi:predicted acetyltransferase
MAQQLENYKRQLSSMREEICFLERMGDAETLDEYEREAYKLEQKIIKLTKKIHGDDAKVSKIMAFDYVDPKNDWNRKHYTIENPEEFAQNLNETAEYEREKYAINDLKELRSNVVEFDISDDSDDNGVSSNVLKLQSKLKNLKIKLNTAIDNDEDDDYEELLLIIKATKKKLKKAMAEQNKVNSGRDKKANELAEQIKKLQSEYKKIVGASEIDKKFAEFDLSSSANVGVDVRRDRYRKSYRTDSKKGTVDSNGVSLVRVRTPGSFSPPRGNGFDYIVKSRIM